MIVIGYQGIGKSTVTKNQSRDSLRYIDLESSNFWYDGKRPEHWEQYYCNIAEHLSRQGFIVFVSSHSCVVERLESSDEDVLIICPAQSLKMEWTEKLRQRYLDTQLEKDYKAWKNAESRYTENIYSLTHSHIHTCTITTMEYNLTEVISYAIPLICRSVNVN